MPFATLTAQEAAALIEHDECVALSGFTPAGTPKAVPSALAARARAEHAAGRPFRIQLITGANTSSFADNALAEAGAISRRMPFQSSPELRAGINGGEVAYMDLHLSQVAEMMRRGLIPRVHTLILEATALTDDGEITLSTAVGNTPTFCRLAERIIVELNTYHKPELAELHDLYELQTSQALYLDSPRARIGTRTIKVHPQRIVGVVHTHHPDYIPPFKAGTDLTARMGEQVTRFLEAEILAGRIPAEGLPLQSGIGNIADAVLGAIGKSAIIPPFSMYSEVAQDSVISLMRQGRCLFASCCSLTVSDEVLKGIYEDWDFFRDKLVLRPIEITNNRAIVQAMGLIAINTALEVDIYGNVNSTHVAGSKVMNGIGGSGDFSRTATLNIFCCPSTAKGENISSIVPMVTHVDHTEHEVHVIVTEYGVADLRGKSPDERAQLIINNCVHPSYRPLLQDYRSISQQGHIPHCLSKAFAMHEAYHTQGSMLRTDFHAEQA